MSDTTTTDEVHLGMPDGATRLPSGGYVVMRPTSSATGRDVKRIRQALNHDGTGDIFNAAMATAIGVLAGECMIVNWQGQGEAKMLNHPAVLDTLPADDMMAIEDMVRPWVQGILRPEGRDAAADPN